MDVGAVQTDGQRQVRAGQLIEVPLTALGEHGLFGTELTLQPPGHRGDLVADRAAVQGPSQRQDLTEQVPGEVERHHRGESGLQVHQLRGTTPGQDRGQRAEGGRRLGGIGSTRAGQEAWAVGVQRPEQDTRTVIVRVSLWR